MDHGPILICIFCCTKVPEETVLNDTAGLHLGAGPYFLIYSRALPEEQENVRVQWVEQLKASDLFTLLGACP